MPNFQFIGRVLPATPKVSFQAPTISIDNRNNGLELSLALKIEKSVITIAGVANRFNASDFGALMTHASHLANSAVGLIGFAEAIGFRAILDEFIDPTGKPGPVLPQEPKLKQFCKSYSLDDPLSFDSVFKNVSATPYLFMALSDLIVGLYNPDEAAIVCARAVETIRRHLAPEDAAPSEQWLHMHKTLRVTKSFLEPITGISYGPRHGDRLGALTGDISVVAERSWVIMDRCLELTKRRVQILPEAEFPLL